MLLRLLGYLMHLANREGKNIHWYQLKDKLCKKYGLDNGQDIQYLEGKKCSSCDGTGIYKKYTHYGCRREYCWHCTDGWYKKPTYVILERTKVGSYIFHRPKERIERLEVFDKFDLQENVTITGYIHHKKHKNGWLAMAVLFMIFDWKVYWKYMAPTGMGWRTCWWQPRNYLNNFRHIVRYGRGSIPFRGLFGNKVKVQRIGSADDLPF